jgi:hypothetical protein
MSRTQPLAGEDLCDACEQPIKAGEEVRQLTGAGSVDREGRLRLLWRHTACDSVGGAVVAEVAPPPWQDWIRLLVSDPFGAAQRIYELEQRLAALEGRRR